MSCLPDQTQPDVFPDPIAIPENKTVFLRVEVDYERLLFAFRTAGSDSEWQWLPGQFDASILADEAGPQWNPNFTGAFVGMCCQDMSGSGLSADFDYFRYRQRNYLIRPDMEPAAE